MLLVSFSIQSDIILWIKNAQKKAYSGTNNIKIPIAHEDSVGYNIAKASIILKPTSLFQMSAQRGYNFIFQPSEYLLI